MRDTGSRLLFFINRVRAVQELDPLRYLAFLGATLGDEDGCVLARAMECAIGGASDPVAAVAGSWVMRFADRWTARVVALEVGQKWHTEHNEVELPEDVIDFAVAFEFGEIERDEIGFVRAWRVPIDGDDLSRGMYRFAMPGMDARLTGPVPA